MLKAAPLLRDCHLRMLYKAYWSAFWPALSALRVGFTCQEYRCRILPVLAILEQNTEPFD